MNYQVSHSPPKELTQPKANRGKALENANNTGSVKCTRFARERLFGTQKLAYSMQCKAECGSNRAGSALDQWPRIERMGRMILARKLR